MDLVERLTHKETPWHLKDLHDEAADELTRLQAENSSLSFALADVEALERGHGMKLTASEVREAIKQISYNNMTAYTIAEAVQDALIAKIKSNGAVAYEVTTLDGLKMVLRDGSYNLYGHSYTPLYAIGKDE